MKTTILCGTALIAVTAGAAPVYKVQVITDEFNTTVRALNNDRTAVGSRGPADFVWTLANGFTSLGARSANDINASGWVCGQTTGAGTASFVYRPGQGTTVIDLSADPTFEEKAVAVSDSGIVVGVVIRPNLPDLSWTWSEQTGVVMIDPLPQFAQFVPRDVNSAGVVVGHSSDQFDAGWTATRYTIGQGMEILPGEDIVAVNDRGDTLNFTTSGGGLFDESGQALYSVTTAYDVNELRYTVGNAEIFRPDGSSVLLSSVVDDYSGWRFEMKRVNDRGDIVGAIKNGFDVKQVMLLRDPVVVTPNTFAVTYGQVAQGDANSLLAQDGDALRVCKFLVPNQQAAPVNVQVSGVCPAGTLESLKLVVRSRMVNNGVFAQTLALFDFADGAYSTVDKRTDSLTTAYKTVELPATLDPGRYVSGSRVVRVRYQVAQTGPSSVSLWCHDVDLVRWELTYPL